MIRSLASKKEAWLLCKKMEESIANSRKKCNFDPENRSKIGSISEKFK